MREREREGEKKAHERAKSYLYISFYHGEIINQEKGALRERGRERETKRERERER